MNDNCKDDYTKIVKASDEMPTEIYLDTSGETMRRWHEVPRAMEGASVKYVSVDHVLEILGGLKHKTCMDCDFNLALKAVKEKINAK